MTRRGMRTAALALAGALVVSALGSARAQQPPAAALRLLGPDGARTLPTVVVNDVEYIALDEVAGTFDVVVREDAVTRALTVSAQGRTVVLMPDQSIASVGGRLISLPAPPARIGNRWHVPVEFLGRALGPLLEQRIEVRRPSRMVITGDLRVPRVLVRHDLAAGHPRLTIDITPNVPHTVAQQNGQLLVRFEAAAIDATVAGFTPDEAVTAVQVVEPASLGVALGPRFGSFRATDVPTEGPAGRLVIDVFVATPTTTGPAAPAAPAPAEPPPPPAAFPGAVRTVVIDPGHGGDDRGTRGPKGTLEKDVTLAVARRLKAAIESRLGGRVLLTRDDDRAVSADDRAALANNNKADVFISLHANAALQPGIAGPEVFIFSTTAADLPAAAGPVAMPVFGGGTREIDVVPWDRAQSRHVVRSRALGAAVAERLHGVLGGDGADVIESPVRVLGAANMPAVLVELGYLTNPQQEQQLAAADVQARIVAALLDAIAQHLPATPAQPGIPSP